MATVNYSPAYVKNENSEILKCFNIQIELFDGDCIIADYDAYTEAEAIALAENESDQIDYIMINSCTELRGAEIEKFNYTQPSKVMGKKTRKPRASKAKASKRAQKVQTVAQVIDTNPTATPKLIVAKHLKNGRWYVYFSKVRPADNVGCACKTAASAIRYMYLLRSRHGAYISQNCLDRLAFEASRTGAKA